MNDVIDCLLALSLFVKHKLLELIFSHDRSKIVKIFSQFSARIFLKDLFNRFATVRYLKILACHVMVNFAALWNTWHIVFICEGLQDFPADFIIIYSNHLWNFKNIWSLFLAYNIFFHLLYSIEFHDPWKIWRIGMDEFIVSDIVRK